MKKTKCEICKKVVKKGEGITITTDGLKNHTRMHQECFDEMWADFMNLDKSDDSPKNKKAQEKDYTTTCDNCGKIMPLKNAIKLRCGCRCYDYFCDEECKQAFINI